LLACVYLPVLLPSLWRKFITNEPKPDDNPKTLFDIFVNSSIACLVFFYTYIVITLSNPFYCVYQPDGSYTLFLFPSLNCYDSGWFQNLPYVVFFIMMYVIVAPAIIGVQLRHNRNAVKTPQFKARYGSLTSPYSDTYFYWEFVVTTKKILLSLILRVLTVVASPATQKFWIISFLFAAMIVDIFVMPYNSPFRNQCNLLFNIFGIMVLLSDAIIFSNAGSSSMEVFSLAVILVILYVGVFLFAVSHLANDARTWVFNLYRNYFPHFCPSTPQEDSPCTKWWRECQSWITTAWARAMHPDHPDEVYVLQTTRNDRSEHIPENNEDKIDVDAAVNMDPHLRKSTNLVQDLEEKYGAEVVNQALQVLKHSPHSLMVLANSDLNRQNRFPVSQRRAYQSNPVDVETRIPSPSGIRQSAAPAGPSKETVELPHIEETKARGVAGDVSKSPENRRKSSSFTARDLSSRNPSSEYLGDHSEGYSLMGGKPKSGIH
jgi:hypothetical protein